MAQKVEKLKILNIGHLFPAKNNLPGTKVSPHVVRRRRRRRRYQM